MVTMRSFRRLLPGTCREFILNLLKLKIDAGKVYSKSSGSKFIIYIYICIDVPVVMYGHTEV